MGIFSGELILEKNVFIKWVLGWFMSFVIDNESGPELRYCVGDRLGFDYTNRATNQPENYPRINLP